jgi:hypothetical protein
LHLRIQSAFRKEVSIQSPLLLLKRDIRDTAGHITWTRMVIIGVLDSLPGVTTYEERLLHNYEDMEMPCNPITETTLRKWGI